MNEKTAAHGEVVQAPEPAPNRGHLSAGRRRTWLGAAIGVVAVVVGLSTLAAPQAAAASGSAYDYLVARHDGKCLDITGASTANGAKVQQWTCLGYWHPNQQFRFVEIGLTGWYQIVANHDGKCLDVTGASVADGASVQQYDCLGAGQYNQQFRFQQEAPGWYEIIARHSGKCLDVSAVSTADGAALQQYTCLGAGQLNQQFAMDIDHVTLTGHKRVTGGVFGEWHLETWAYLIQARDANTDALVRSYVAATTTASSSGFTGFHGCTTVQLSPSGVSVPSGGTPTGVGAFASNPVNWGSPSTTGLTAPVATTSTALTPYSSFSVC